MRGEVLDIDDGGAGIISGDDGARYRFHNRDVTRFIVQKGDRIDFVAVDGQATEILLLSASATPFRSTDYTQSRRVEPDAGSPWGYFARCMSKYVNGDGRAAPREYWWFVFFRFAIIIAVATPGIVIGIALPDDDAASAIAGLSVVLGGLVFIGTILPDLAGKVRRLHDMGVTGFAILLGIIPFGSLVVLIMLIMPSNAYPNSYGPVPQPARPDRGDGRWD